MKFGKYVMESKWISLCITGVSKNSYSIFLIQHVVIMKIPNAWKPNSVESVIAVIFGGIILIVVEAKMLDLVSGYVTRNLISLKKK